MRATLCRHCGQPTKGGDYLPGHNARHAALLFQGIMLGNTTIRQAQAEVDVFGRTWDKVVEKLVDAGYYSDLEVLATELARGGWGEHWLDQGYNRFGAEAERLGVEAAGATQLHRTHKLSAIRAYFQTSDYQPTTDARTIRGIILRSAS